MHLFRDIVTWVTDFLFGASAASWMRDLTTQLGWALIDFPVAEGASPTAWVDFFALWALVLGVGINLIWIPCRLLFQGQTIEEERQVLINDLLAAHLDQIVSTKSVDN